MIEQLESQILEDAVEVLDKFGWCQNSLVSYDGHVCLVGAIYQAAGYISINEEHYGDGIISYEWTIESALLGRDAERARRAVGNHLNGAVEEWNDQNATSKEEVQDLLMTVAKQLRNEGR